MAKHDKKGRSTKESRHVQLYHWLMETPAWKSLSALERGIYVELKRRYNGSNNGRLACSVRDAAEEFNAGKSTVSDAMRTLQECGFISCETKGGFNRKVRHATEWRLTECNCDVTGELATKDFTRWRPPPPKDKQKNKDSVPDSAQQFENAVPVAGRTVPVEGHSVPVGGQSTPQKQAHGTQPGTVDG